MIAKDEQFKNLWQGEPCLIIGSGKTRNYQPFNPALNDFRGKVIGCNTAFAVGYKLDALLWIDRNVYKQNKGAIDALDLLKFSITASPNGTDYTDQINWIKAIQPERFSDSLDKGLYPADLSGYLALNLAYIMGCDPIYLYGFDSHEQPYFKKAERFRWAAKKAKEDSRMIYSTGKDSVFCQGENPIFRYAEIPIGYLSAMYPPTEELPVKNKVNEKPKKATKTKKPHKNGDKK